MSTSKTKQALLLVAQGMKPFVAAKHVGLAPNALYVALKKEREKLEASGICPHCGQPMPKTEV